MSKPDLSKDMCREVGGCQEDKSFETQRFNARIASVASARRLDCSPGKAEAISAPGTAAVHLLSRLPCSSGSHVAQILLSAVEPVQCNCTSGMRLAPYRVASMDR